MFLHENTRSANFPKVKFRENSDKKTGNEWWPLADPLLVFFNFLEVYVENFQRHPFS